MAAECKAAKPKFDYYQTESVVTVSVLVKGVPKDNLKVEFEETRLHVLISESESNGSYELDIQLFGSITPAHCRTIHKATKIELKLEKKTSLHWASLEAKEIPKVITSLPPSYSSKKNVNWDQLVQEEEADGEGDEALNKLFKNIYDGADEATKRAMNKSFTESNGTVLSTNWNEIGKEKVEVKPPDGVEYKKWEN